MESKKAAITAKVANCIALGEKLFNVTLPHISIRFDLRGRAAGMAGCKLSHSRGPFDFYVRFNTTAMASDRDWYHMISNTVAHELAHSFCQAFPQLGANHNAGWVRVCLALGGNGKRTYSGDDMPDAVLRLRPVTYTTTSGATIAVTKRMHTKIQSGASYITPTGKINNACTYTTSEVQVQSKAVQTTTLGTSGSSKADQVRATIARLKSEVGSEAFEMSVAWAVTTLGMSASLARTYVKNNWNRV